MEDFELDLSELEAETLELMESMMIGLEAVTTGHAMTEIGASIWLNAGGNGQSYDSYDGYDR